jgi:outer membrane protein
LGLGLSQLITDFGRTSALVDSSKFDLAAQTERTTLTREQVLLNVTAAYFGVLRAQALVEVAERTRASRQSLLEQVQGLRDAALRSDLDLSIAKQGVSDADLLLLRARTAVDDGYASLAEAMGASGQERPALSEAFDTPPPPDDLATIQGIATDHNPGLRALADDVASAKKRADAEARDRFPTISAVGFAGVTPQRDPAGAIKQNYAAGGLTLDVPLFQGGRLSAKQNEARLAAESLQERYDSEKNLLLRDVSIAFGNTRTAFENIPVTDQLMRNAQQTLDLTQARYNIGQSSIVDLNQAQLAATQAQIAHEDAVFDYRMQRARLDYETGALAPPAASDKR